LLGAREEIANLSSDSPRVIELVQYLAHADYLWRHPHAFDPAFSPIPEVSAELSALLTVFNAAKGLEASELCIMNPVFVRSDDVGGADADLVLDSALVEIKVVKAMKADFDYMI
jgi:hypothetical protein